MLTRLVMRLKEVEGVLLLFGMIQNFRFLLLNMVTGGLVCMVSICKVVLSVLLLVFMPLVFCQKNGTSRITCVSSDMPSLFRG